MTLHLLKISAFTHIYININIEFSMEVNTEGEAPRRRKKKRAQDASMAQLLSETSCTTKKVRCVYVSLPTAPRLWSAWPPTAAAAQLDWLQPLIQTVLKALWLNHQSHSQNLLLLSGSE